MKRFFNNKGSKFSRKLRERRIAIIKLRRYETKRKLGKNLRGYHGPNR